MLIHLTVNNQDHEIDIPPDTNLLSLLRDELGLHGVKHGCETGECGACTVLLNGTPVNSCLVLAHEADGQEVLTVEGLSKGGTLHPIQKAFVEHGAIQCGFCTPGMIMSTKALLDRNPKATRDEIRHALKGNLCRCTGYVKIMEAVEAAEDLMREGGPR